jgi:hypothetical protein
MTPTVSLGEVEHAFDASAQIHGKLGMRVPDRLQDARDVPGLDTCDRQRGKHGMGKRTLIFPGSASRNSAV